MVSGCPAQRRFFMNSSTGIEGDYKNLFVVAIFSPIFVHHNQHIHCYGILQEVQNNNDSMQRMRR